MIIHDPQRIGQKGLWIYYSMLVKGLMMSVMSIHLFTKLLKWLNTSGYYIMGVSTYPTDLHVECYDFVKSI